MKRLAILAMFVAIVLSVNAQYKMQVWMNGSALDFPVSQVDSITFVKDTPDIPDVPNPDPNPNPSNGIGVFSVSATKQVTFSKGNLQYHPANDKWRFAENQTDYIGDANSNISSTYNGWLDLFGWSTSATNFGVSTSTNNADYSGSFVDWGTNKIGNDTPNTWRTLTKDEWNYLLNTRTNADALCGIAQVNGVNGLILLPDNWTCPAGVTFKSGFHSNMVLIITRPIKFSLPTSGQNQKPQVLSFSLSQVAVTAQMCSAYQSMENTGLPLSTIVMKLTSFMLAQAVRT